MWKPQPQNKRKINSQAPNHKIETKEFLSNNEGQRQRNEHKRKIRTKLWITEVLQCKETRWDELRRKQTCRI